MWGQDLIPPNGDFCIFLEAIEQGNLFICISITSKGNMSNGTMEGWEWLRTLYISVQEIGIFFKKRIWGRDEVKLEDNNIEGN